MKATKIETVVEADGQLHLTNLPCRRGTRVEVIVLVAEDAGESERELALQRFLAGARASTFRSVDPYPTRDDLHERD